MATKPKKAPDIKTLQAEVKYLRAENRRMGEVLTGIQTMESRKLVYDGLTLPKAKQIGVNINARIEYASGDITWAQMKRAVKFVAVPSSA